MLNYLLLIIITRWNNKIGKDNYFAMTIIDNYDDKIKMIIYGKDYNSKNKQKIRKKKLKITKINKPSLIFDDELFVLTNETIKIVERNKKLKIFQLIDDDNIIRNWQGLNSI